MANPNKTRYTDNHVTSETAPRNIAVILAGGHGRRFSKTDIPKQFHELNGKPILIYTLEHFERNDKIDAIVIACLESWISELERLLKKFKISKVEGIVRGGVNYWLSTHNVLKHIKKHDSGNPIVLIHDGVRPLIDAQTIDRNIEAVRKYGSCITCTPAIETYANKKNDGKLTIPKRDDLLIVRAPQSFYLNEIWAVYEKARSENHDRFIDCCSMMNHYGMNLHTIMGSSENIKITYPMDFLVFKAIEEARKDDDSLTSDLQHDSF